MSADEDVIRGDAKSPEKSIVDVCDLIRNPVTRFLFDDSLWLARTTFTNFAQPENRFTQLLEHRFGFVGLVSGDNDRHADTAIEDTMHLRIFDTALLLKPGE